MTFEEIICANAKVREGKLLGPSKKCADKPDNGITVVKPAAYHVIKDCAVIANKYVPLYVFGTYANPFRELSGKFTTTVIKDFVSRAQNDIHTFQLMRHIIDRGRHLVDIKATATAVATSYEVDDDNPYGDYDTEEETVIEEVVIDADEVDILIKLFSK